MTSQQLTVGVVTPHAAAGPEVELPAMTRDRVATVVVRTEALLDASRQPSRIPPADHRDLLDSTMPAALDLAAAAFAGKTLSAVVHASTTTGYVLGRREEAALVERLAQRFDLPAVASCAAVVAALRTEGCERVQVVHPPWFTHEFDELGAAYFRSHGFDAVVTKAVALPKTPAQVDPQPVIDWVEHHVQDRTEAILLAGTGFPAARAIEELERRTGRLVIEANQALLWAIMATTGSRWHVIGHGRLLHSTKGAS
jgi:maleate isomerase